MKEKIKKLKERLKCEDTRSGNNTDCFRLMGEMSSRGWEIKFMLKLIKNLYEIAMRLTLDIYKCWIFCEISAGACQNFLWWTSPGQLRAEFRWLELRFWLFHPQQGLGSVSFLYSHEQIQLVKMFVNQDGASSHLSQVGYCSTI